MLFLYNKANGTFDNLPRNVLGWGDLRCAFRNKDLNFWQVRWTGLLGRIEWIKFHNISLIVLVLLPPNELNKLIVFL